VGRYGVGVAGFEREIVPSIGATAHLSADLIVIDEIGKMECFSLAFRDAVWLSLDGPLPVLGTIAKTGGSFMAQVRSLPDVELIEVMLTKGHDIPLRLPEHLRKEIRTVQGANR